MSTPNNIGGDAAASSEILEAIRELGTKIDGVVRASRMPNIPPSTMATALLLTGITSHTRIAKLLCVGRQALYESDEFAAFRLAEGSIRSRFKAGQRGRSGAEYTEDYED